MDELLFGFSAGIAFCVAVLAIGKGCVESLERDRRIRIANERARLAPNVRVGSFDVRAWPERAL